MKAIIAGGRFITEEQVREALSLCPWTNQITQVITGRCLPRFDRKRRVMVSADYWGEVWAKEQGLPVDPHPALWGVHGKFTAGPIRNGEMVALADALLLVWDGSSNGSTNVLKQAKAKQEADPSFLIFEHICATREMDLYEKRNQESV
jgi:hypothetical protein